jgi:anti-sigma factor RsiW
MNCTECRSLLEAHSDGELDLVRHVEVEAHLKACPECSRILDGLAVRKAKIRGSLPRYTAPAELKDRIRASLRTEAPEGERGVAIPFPVARRRWSVVGLAASGAALLFAGYSWGGYRAHRDAVMDEVFAEHVRSLQAGHLTDVISTDRHTVKPWFAGKVDFSPPVVDLSDIGFPLAGGRLDEIDGRAAAALVFHRRLHAINVFVWPANGAPPVPRRAARNGYSALGWTEGGLDFLAVSEIPESDLEQFVGEFRRRTE